MKTLTDFGLQRALCGSGIHSTSGLIGVHSTRRIVSSVVATQWAAMNASALHLFCWRNRTSSRRDHLPDPNQIAALIHNSEFAHAPGLVANRIEPGNA